MIIEYVLALGIAMISSAVTVYFRDLEHILGIVTMAWMYMTPIMYSSDIVPNEYMTLFNLNPMTPVISAYRDVLYYSKIPEMANLTQAFFMGISMLVIGWYIFSKLEKHFAEEL